MPELPEVETVRLTLGRHILGKRVVNATLRRDDILQGSHCPDALLVGQVIQELGRHGKQLAIHTPGQGPALCVHLGMTGSLRYHPPQTPEHDPLLTEKHVHLLWQLDNDGWLTFRDPRRFGGVWAYPDKQTLQAERWACLGPDALTITPGKLYESLIRTQRPIKAALLDQTLVAGLGNIYVDETLFACGVHPLTPGQAVDLPLARELVKRFKAILKRAIRSGGSTIRNYANGEGQAGAFQTTLQVYGRAGQPCRTCSNSLISQTLAGRTTVFCPRCQPRGG